MHLLRRAASTIGVAIIASMLLLTFNSSTASAVTSAPSPHSVTYGPSYDTWSQHPTGVTVTYFSTVSWYPVPKLNIYAKAARYRFDYRSRWVAQAAQIKLGSLWKSVPLDNTYRYVGSVPAGTSFGSVGGWFVDNAQHNLDWYGRAA